MPANAVPAEDGVRETERTLRLAQKLYDWDSVDRTPWEKCTDELQRTYHDLAKLAWAEVVAALAQQADGEQLVADFENALADLHTGSGRDPTEERTALLAHVAGQAARHREEREKAGGLMPLLLQWGERLRDPEKSGANILDFYSTWLNQSHVAERAAEAEVARLRARVAEYGGHTNECERTRLGTCNCGWQAIALSAGRLA